MLQEWKKWTKLIRNKSYFFSMILHFPLLSMVPVMLKCRDGANFMLVMKIKI